MFTLKHYMKNFTGEYNLTFPQLREENSRKKKRKKRKEKRKEKGKRKLKKGEKGKREEKTVLKEKET